MNQIFSRLLLVSTLSVPGYADVQTHRIDPGTGAENWETQSHGVTVSLTQILPDQVRAFYVNRGFPLEVTERYATSCVFMTVLRNDSAPGVVHFKQENWRVVSADHKQPPISLDSWMKIWEAYDLDKPALLAFRWAQFPQEHWYEPVGDWNQGMLTTGLPAGAKFKLMVRWEVAGKEYEEVINDVECAE